jgi:hypothetical protein
MPKARFKVPADERPRLPEDAEDLNEPPPVVPPCAYLREKATGMVHVYSDWMARRGDLVEACDGPDERRGFAASLASPSSLPPPPPPPPPSPPSPPMPRTPPALRRDKGIAHSSVELSLNAFEPGTR